MYITLQLLGPQTDYMDYTESEQQEIELMAEYTALYLLRPQVSPEFPACRGLRNIRDIRAVIWPGRSLTRIQTTGQ